MTQSLSSGGGVDYPDLAVKLIFLVMLMRALKHILTFVDCLVLLSPLLP